MRLPRPSPGPRRIPLRLIRLLGGLAAFAALVGGAALAARWPAFAPYSSTVATAVAWWIGKTLGIPMEGITQAALTHMQPAKVVEIVLGAVHSMPPAEAAEVATQLKSVRPPPPPVELVNIDIEVPLAPDGSRISPPPPRDRRDTVPDGPHREPPTDPDATG